MKALFNQWDCFVNLKYSPTGSQFGDWEKLLTWGCDTQVRVFAGSHRCVTFRKSLTPPGKSAP